MKKFLFAGMIAILAIPAVSVFAQTNLAPITKPIGGPVDITPIPPPTTGDIIQFNNLSIYSVSGTDGAAEILAIQGDAVAAGSASASSGSSVTPNAVNLSPLPSANCLKFNNLDSASGVQAPCPAPVPLPTPNPLPFNPYRLEIGSDTILMLRTRASARLSDFAAGDRINVFGYYNADGTVRALVVRNLSKPNERTFIQLNNAEVVGMSDTNPKTFVVVQRPEYPCQKFNGDTKSNFPCPMGLQSLSMGSVAAGIQVPASVSPIMSLVRKYEVHATAKTIFLDRERKTLSPSSVAVGDKLNIYGSYSDTTAQSVEAEIIRDLSQPALSGDGDNDNTNNGNRFEGIVTQINSADGSFVLRTRDGSLVTIANPITTGSFLSIQGKLDDLSHTVKNITQLLVKNLTDRDAIPVISQLVPGSGTVGTQVTIMGSGFTPSLNSINFAGAKNAITNLSSPDGKTLTFTIPATPCAAGSICAQVVLQPGMYDVSVTNANGTSDSATFQVTALPALSITTPSLPQVVQNENYVFALNGEGGTDSYSWSATGLPSGLSLVSAVCITAPCKAPATITGIPTIPGTYTVTVGLKSGSETISHVYTLVVVPALNAPGY